VALDTLLSTPAFVAHESALERLLQMPAVLHTLLAHMKRPGSAVSRQQQQSCGVAAAASSPGPFIAEMQGVFRLSGDSVEIDTTSERLHTGAQVGLHKGDTREHGPRTTHEVNATR